MFLKNSFGNFRGWLYPFSRVGWRTFRRLAGRWWSRNNPRARMLVPAIGLLVAAPCVLLASTTASLAIAVSGFMVYALTKAFSDVNTLSRIRSTVPSTGYGILNFFSCIIGGIGLYVAPDTCATET